MSYRRSVTYILRAVSSATIFAVLSAVLIAQPALAEHLAATDPSGDVQYFAAPNTSEPPTNARDHANGDLQRYALHYGEKRISFRLKFREFNRSEPVVTTAALTGWQPATAVTPDSAAASIDRFVDRIIPKGAAGTLVAMRGHRIVSCRGFGLADHANRVAAGCDTVYDIGSLTKQFTAAAVVKLEMLGRIDVHDPISRWFGSVPPDKAGITIQQLLTHTSGLVASLGGDYQPLTRRQLLARAFASPLRTAPGTAYHYSNVGYSLLAVIIARASGTSYERFLARRLFRPAHMTQTGYVLPHWRRCDVAVEYDARGKPHGRPYRHPWAASGPWWNLRGNGGLLSSARDLARWHRALLDRRVLDQHALRELFRPRVPEEPGGDSWYGYGWVLVDTTLGRVAWHNGGNGWSYAELTRVLSHGAMVFWVTNQVRSTAGRWDLEQTANRITSGVVRRLLP